MKLSDVTKSSICLLIGFRPGVKACAIRNKQSTSSTQSLYCTRKFLSTLHGARICGFLLYWMNFSCVLYQTERRGQHFIAPFTI